MTQDSRNNENLERTIERLFLDMGYYIKETAKRHDEEIDKLEEGLGESRQKCQDFKDSTQKDINQIINSVTDLKARIYTVISVIGAILIVIEIVLKFIKP